VPAKRGPLVPTRLTFAQQQAELERAGQAGTTKLGGGGVRERPPRAASGRRGIAPSVRGGRQISLRRLTGVAQRIMGAPRVEACPAGCEQKDGAAGHGWPHGERTSVLDSRADAGWNGLAGPG
jgi:hypothetical protein